LFLNNDSVVDDPLWLRRVAYFAVQKDIAAIGAKLLYPDRTIQHGGVVLGIQGVAAHDLVGLEEYDRKARLDMTREMSAVTGACLAIRKEVFDEIGGFDTVVAVAFNDTLLCLDALKAGYRNIYIKEPLLIHYESKSRGYDDKPERVAMFQREARYARGRHNELFRDDPYYSPNLCLQQVNEIAFPPRQCKPWRVARRNITKLKILFLSSVHEIGHGVPVVMNMQATYLAALGHDVYVGGPQFQREVPYAGCQRVYLSGAAEAAAYAVAHGMDCVVVETPPYFSIVRWLGEWPRTLFLDYGEPPAELFSDAAARQTVVAEKQLCSTMASKVFAISACVRAEGSEERAQIIALGNSHLVIWDEGLRWRRQAVRNKLGWADKVVVLNVCRFHAAERGYKGLDKYAEVFNELQFARPKLAAQTVFALCGKADPADVAEMQKVGFEVFANLTDSEMSEFYLAADVYANFSRWEGYNLGIGQALALGLPVIASDIPAHRAFPIATSSDMLTIIEKLSAFVETTIEERFAGGRTPVIMDWKDSLVKLEREIVELCGGAEALCEPKFTRV
jgi:glycosyltransferase involved in cell wall biosynthesis